MEKILEATLFMRWVLMLVVLLSARVFEVEAAKGNVARAAATSDVQAADGKDDERDEGRGSVYSFGIIPALAFDSDLGLKYGAVVNIFDHGMDKKAPLYNQHLFVRLTNTTGGSLTAQALLESESLFSSARFLGEVSYIRDKRLDFFGFNGRNAVYQEDFTRQDSESFLFPGYYTKERSLLRLRLDFQHYLTGKHFRMLTGIQHNRVLIDPIGGGNEPAGEAAGKAPDAGASLFHQYITWGILPDAEHRGGVVNMLTFGLVYDTRNDHCYCTDGLWIDAFAVVAPGFMGKHSFSKLIMTYRQHIGFFDERMVLSLRASSQHKLHGTIPYYMLPTFFDSRLSQDGIGGAFNLRGAMRNRIVSDGFAIANVETKIRLTDFYLFRQYFYASVSLFWDMAYVTQPYQINVSSVPDVFRSQHFSNQPQKVHQTVGPGLYIVFNRNNAITINYGFSTNPQDGHGGLYIGSSLLF